MKRKLKKISRRSFIKNSALAFSLPYIIPSSVFRESGRPAPSNRITMGLIGLGSMGMRHVKGFLQESDCQIIAVCDVDASRLNAGAKEINKHYENKDCILYDDFRDLISDGGLDTLCISVPDHWHSIPAIEGIRAGKDIYGEKPLALTISEGQAIVEAVHRYNCIWQTGSWQRSTTHFRFGCELVRNKRIGKLQKVEVGIGGGFNPGGGKPTVNRIEPQPIMSVPNGFNYEMWLGPALWAPYTEKRCHWNFRWNMDYSGGQVTDWGAHHIDIAHWGMGCDETGPVKVSGRGVFPENGLWNTAVDYDFKCTYDDNLMLYVGSNNHYPQGIRFTGDKGWVHITRGGLNANPKRLLKEKIDPEEIHLSRPRGDHRQGHRRDFLDCVKTRAVPITPVDIGHRSATVAHLGNIAMILEREIRWNPKSQRIINDSEASRMLSCSLHSPWSI